MVISTTYDILYTLNNGKFCFKPLIPFQSNPTIDNSFGCLISYLGNKYQPFLVFSIYTNGLKLLAHDKSKSTETIDCIHGIRALSTFSIVLHHVLLMYEVLPIRDRTKILEVSTHTHRNNVKKCILPDTHRNI